MAKADKYLDQARSMVDDDTDDRVRIEIELVAAKTSAKREDYSGTVDGLVQAIGLIDESINDAGRLHYRRGVRENYRNRISNILASIPDKGDGKQILPIIAFLKSNSTSDWLSLLDWYDSVVSNVGVPEALRVRLRAAIDRVAGTGAPILYGFREKYDEPWAWPWVVDEKDLSSSAPSPAPPWAELNNVISDIYGAATVPRVFERASSLARARIMASCLEHNQCLFSVTLNEVSASVYVIGEAGFTRLNIAIQTIFDLHTMFQLTKQGSEPTGDFRARLQAIATDMSALFAPVLDIICENKVERMVLLPDALFLPISAVLVMHEGTRKRMLDGKLSVVTCPVPHARNQSYKGIKSIAGCTVADDDLKLNVAEVDRIGKVMCPSSLQRVRISAGTLCSNLLNNDILHIAAHGTPISLLTDAFFSDTNPTTLDAYGLQRGTWSSTHQLVFLNSCFSADTLNWNYFKPFTTNEQYGLPVVFLLNRRSAVVASQWGTFDVSAYIFASLFYSALRDKGDMEVAFAIATAQLYEMDVTMVRDILAQLSDPEIRDEKQARLPQSGQPFQHPYVCGAYQFLSLL
jgi:hypothetical protein